MTVFGSRRRAHSWTGAFRRHAACAVPCMPCFRAGAARRNGGVADKLAIVALASAEARALVRVFFLFLIFGRSLRRRHAEAARITSAWRRRRCRQGCRRSGASRRPLLPRRAHLRWRCRSRPAWRPHWGLARTSSSIKADGTTRTGKWQARRRASGASAKLCCLHRGSALGISGITAWPARRTAGGRGGRCGVHRGRTEVRGRRRRADVLEGFEVKRRVVGLVLALCLRLGCAVRCRGGRFTTRRAPCKH